MTTHSDTEANAIETETSESDFEASILKDWGAQGLPDNNPEDDEAEDVEDDSEGAQGLPDDEDETSDATDDVDESEEEAAEATAADPKAVHKIKIGDEEISMTVEEMAKEVSLRINNNKKSIELSDARKELDDRRDLFNGLAKTMLESAYERYKPFEDIDKEDRWPELAQTLSKEEYKAYRAVAEAAKRDFEYLRQGYIEERQRQQVDANKLKAQRMENTIRELQDPVKGIGLNEKIVAELNKFANEHLPAETIPEMLEPGHWKLTYWAMLYLKGKNAKVEMKTPKGKKFVKTSTNVETTRRAITGNSQSDAAKRLKNSGSGKDFVDSILSDWDSYAKRG
jgi:hypothetical protein